MRYPPPNWHSWPPPSPTHSTEVEGRLTREETHREHQDDWNEATEARLDKHDRRLNLHEKAILGLGALLQILMQDKYPGLAALIKGLMP